jgi:hypothetical protein
MLYASLSSTHEAFEHMCTKPPRKFNALAHLIFDQLPPYLNHDLAVILSHVPFLSFVLVVEIASIKVP